GSGVDFGDGTSAEIDFYGGWTPSVGAVDLDFGVLYYLYPAAPQTPNQNYIEFNAGASTSVADFLDVGLSFAYSPDYYLEAGNSLYTQGSLGFTLIPETPAGNSVFSVDVSGTVGYLNFFDEDDAISTTFPFEDYVDFGIGATLNYYGFGLDLRYIAETGLDAADNNSFVASLSRSF
ncbi:MAG: TorF family putative porin, partial [Pseudomonadota bacterium]